jgi:acyl phosphate:glycerol-3-phosphate acyltransferase
MGSILSMVMIEILKYAALLLLAYLLGSIPFGLVLSILFRHQDIRHQGSGNIGATNVLRVAGAKLGLLTLILDLFKGALPVSLALVLVNNPASQWGQIYVGLIVISVFLGHLYPLFLGLRDGGKGVATAWGCFLIVSPVTALITLLVFVMMACLSNKASVASLSAATVLPMVIYYATHSGVWVICAAIISVLIVYRHKQNILRLIHGTESAIWKK